MQFLRSLLIVVFATLIAEAWSRIPVRELVAILIVVMLAAAYLRNRFNETSMQSVVYAAALAALGVLYLGGREIELTSIRDESPVIVDDQQRSGPDPPEIVTRFDKSGNAMTVEFENNFMRQMREKQTQLRQENPKLWRQRIRERLEAVKARGQFGE